MTGIQRIMTGNHLALWAALVTGSILTMAQVMTDPPILLSERFLPGTGWITVVLASVYAGVVITGMKDPRNVQKWRKVTWLVFSTVFFLQLILGMAIDSRFLMTGKLHLPVPAVIIGGPLYRMQLSVMPLLFISTVLLTGPAWCSHLCYFGGFDNLAASGRGMRNKSLKHKMAFKHLFLFVLITTALLFNLLGAGSMVATAAGILTGVAGVVVMLVFSRKSKKMVHCTVYCPLGTLVSYIKKVSPFRMYIAQDCTVCMACTVKCRYDALNLEDIRKGKPALTCTYCGDCLSACHQNSIRYKFMGLSPQAARNLYLVLTIGLHASFIFLARI